jgi:hypothetical protein
MLVTRLFDNTNASEMTRTLQSASEAPIMCGLLCTGHADRLPHFPMSPSTRADFSAMILSLVGSCLFALCILGNHLGMGKDVFFVWLRCCWGGQRYMASSRVLIQL